MIHVHSDMNTYMSCFLKLTVGLVLSFL